MGNFNGVNQGSRCSCGMQHSPECVAAWERKKARLMSLRADSYFSIGKSHQVCQDYAAAGITAQGTAYAIVSDGCSSSLHTDFGSRFMVAGMIEKIDYLDMIPKGRGLLESADIARRVLQLPSTCLDATLVAATVKNDQLRVQMFGDGAFALVTDVGVSQFTSVSYKHGAPGYLSYDLRPERKKVYIDESEDYARTIEHWNVGISITEETKSGDGGDLFSFSTDGLKGIFIFSDGVQSFSQLSETHNLDDISAMLVINEIVSIKSPAGEFLKRRATRFLTKYCTDNRWQHHDDFSCAAIIQV